MARIHFVEKSRASSKGPRTCQLCRKEIPVGAPYKWVKPTRYSGKYVRCAECPTWRQSEITTSKIATALAAQEAATDSLNDLDKDSYLKADGDVGQPAYEFDSLESDIESILSDCASGATDCAAEYQEGLDNMPEGLQQGPTGELIQEKVDALESWEAELQGFTISGTWEQPEREEGEDEEEYVQRCADAAQDFIEEARTEAQDLVDSLEA